MSLTDSPPSSNYLIRMADGTFKQLNPFTGTEVWTVPGRANRPLTNDALGPGRPLEPKAVEDYCVFCQGHLYKAPPEKARMVRTDSHHAILRDVQARELFDTVPEFRRIPNLFEIISYDYWAKNFGFSLPEAQAQRKKRYLSDEAGRRHLLDVVDAKLRMSGVPLEQVAAMSEAEKLEHADAFFGGGHELIIGPRHYVENGETDRDLASSGTMTPDEHERYFRFTVAALRDIYLHNRYVRYVAVFQNWLQPSGASFDHLHKQLVAIDDRGAAMEREIALTRRNPNIYNEAAVNYAGYHNLVFAENDHAIAFAAIGHRFPTLAIYSKSERSQPWNHSPQELRGVSDLVHACHAAMGPGIPCNEEWYYKAPDADVPMPWRVMIKWRISNPAGFEGGTKIYVNTIDPISLRDRVVPRLFQIKNEGRIAPMRIAFECECVPNCLKYNPAVRREPDREQVFPPLSGEARSAAI